MRALALLLALALAPSASASDASTLARSASWYDRYKPRLTRDDCSGLVSDILNRAGFDVYGTVTTIWSWARELGFVSSDRTPRVGDLVFWDRTYDSNRNGRVDDRLTHIGVVVAVDEAGTATIVHRSSSEGITTAKMNLRQPDVHEADGRVLNSYLARPDYAGATGDRLTGQVFAALARVGPSDPAASPEEPALEASGGAHGGASAEPSRDPDPAEPDSALSVSSDSSEPSTREPLPTRRDLRQASRADVRKRAEEGGEPMTAALLLASALSEVTGPRPPPYLVAKARLGSPLSSRELGRLSCDELWWLRNASFARHGYAFRTERARVTFGAEYWYRRDPSVGLHNAAGVLSEVDRDNVRLVLAHERRCDRGR